MKNHTHRGLIRFFIVLVLSVCASNVMAQDSASHSHGIVGAPYIKYAPETGWAGGLVGLYYFDLPSASGSTASRPSSVSGGVSYTQKKQFSLGIHPDLYLGGDAYHAVLGFDYKQ